MVVRNHEDLVKELENAKLVATQFEKRLQTISDSYQKILDEKEETIKMLSDKSINYWRAIIKIRHHLKVKDFLENDIGLNKLLDDVLG